MQTPRKRRRRKLQPHEVAAIRSHAASGLPQKNIALLFGISPAAVSLVVNNKRHAPRA
jgi:predicted transcriptional regulator